MTDNLSRIEVEILNLIYKKDYENDLEVKINESNISLTETESSKKIHEAGYYIERLKRLNYLDFRKGALFHADGIDSKYKNNIYFISWSDIYITSKGNEYIEKNRLKPSEKIIKSTRKLFMDIGKEIRKNIIFHLAKIILSIIFLVLCYLFFIK